MKRQIALLALAVLLTAISGAIPASSAAKPEQLMPKLFDVVVGPGPTLEITFALALNDVSTYPVTITAIAGAVEEPLWEGTLPEGLYRLRVPLTKITAGPVRVVLRVRMTNLDAKKNQSYLVYKRWDGVIK